MGIDPAKVATTRANDLTASSYRQLVAYVKGVRSWAYKDPENPQPHERLAGHRVTDAILSAWQHFNADARRLAAEEKLWSAEYIGDMLKAAGPAWDCDPLNWAAPAPQKGVLAADVKPAGAIDAKFDPYAGAVPAVPPVGAPVEAPKKRGRPPKKQTVEAPVEA